MHYTGKIIYILTQKIYLQTHQWKSCMLHNLDLGKPHSLSCFGLLVYLMQSLLVQIFLDLRSLLLQKQCIFSRKLNCYILSWTKHLISMPLLFQEHVFDWQLSLSNLPNNRDKSRLHIAHIHSQLKFLSCFSVFFIQCKILLHSHSYLTSPHHYF